MHKKNFENKIPIWIMRQAGRYLPEYLAIRKNCPSFLDLCYDSEKVCETTMMPINRFDLDYAIIFSDILVVLDALKIKVSFIKDIGPIVEKIDLLKLPQLNEDDFLNFLKPVYEGIKLTRKSLNAEKDLIGFVGSPWTLASYVIEGGSTKNFAECKNIAYNQPEIFEKLIDLLTDSVILHLKEQIKSGVSIVKLFDSWSGVLNDENFEKWVIKPTVKIVNAIREAYPEVAIITFPKDCGWNYKKFSQIVKPDILALDSNIDLEWVKNNIDKSVILQGNLDPIYLLSSNKNEIIRRTENILNSLHDRKLIFNLGHGILPNTPIDNVKILVETVRKYGQ
jgi:uroporphyrinogen decarboxylase